MKFRNLSHLISVGVVSALLISGCSSAPADSSTKSSAQQSEDQNQEVVTSTMQAKQRTVITTDGEVDDMNSVLRALLYANDMDIAGIVITSSTYHYAGNGKDVEPFRWTGTDWIWNYLDDYEAVYDNLKAHDADYPTPDYLKSVTKIGNITNVGEMEEVTEGSEFLKDLFLDDDDRPLYVQTWGGTNTTARALKSIQEEYEGTDQWEEIQKKIYDKLVLYIILDQDDSYANYIAKEWPELQILNDRSNFWHFAYAWQFHDDALNTTLHGDWMYENLVKDKGQYMQNYALMNDGRTIEGENDEEQRGWDAYLENNPNYEKYDFISEGDSPSFLYLIDTGLRSLENPEWGGWGGRFGRTEENTYKNTVLDFDPVTNKYEASYTLTRWFDAINNDFANRVTWTLTDDDSKVSHAPTVSIKEGIDISAKPGDTVTLTAEGTDPDGDNLTYKWWRYAEADTYEDNKATINEEEEIGDGLLIDLTRDLADGEIVDGITIDGNDQAQMSFVVPEDAKSGDTIHMIVEVHDDSKYNLVHYQRVVITIE